MSQRLPSRSTTPVEKKVARKSYEAPQLEVYGTLQDLTHTSYSPSGTDFGYYSSSTPG